MSCVLSGGGLVEGGSPVGEGGGKAWLEEANEQESVECVPLC